MKTINLTINKETNELINNHGKVIMELPKAANDTTQPNLFKSVFSLMNDKITIKWGIKNYLPLNSTVELYGTSGCGKSFLTLDMALHVVFGMEWNGNKVNQGAVFYIAGEGMTGISNRVRAWSLANNKSFEPDTPFFVSNGAVVLPNEDNQNQLINSIDEWVASTGQNPSIIIFDTFARCFDGNENSSQDTGKFVQAMDAIKQKYGCCVLVIHHSGKNQDSGGRGSSALKAAMDMELFLSDDDGVKRLKTTKAKDIEPPNDSYFTLNSVDTMLLDDDGERIYSAVMQPINESQATKKGTKKKLTTRQDDVLRVVSQSLSVDGIDCPNDIVVKLFPDSKLNAPKRVVHIEKFRNEAYKYLNVADASMCKTLSRELDSLKTNGYISFYDGNYWIIQ